MTFCSKIPTSLEWITSVKESFSGKQENCYISTGERLRCNFFYILRAFARLGYIPD